MEVINVFDRKDASLTVGVIGYYFGGDATLVQFVRDKAANNPSFEVANHGWNH
jgi:peptidoglycan/xylan/chitin deacetylase (PgdA/CDA1 family)